MKCKFRIFCGCLLFIFVASAADAADSFHNLSVKGAAESNTGKAKLLDVPFYMSGQKHAKVAHDFGVFTSNKRTNAFNKSDEAACEIAFLSAMEVTDGLERRCGFFIVARRTKGESQVVQRRDEFRVILAKRAAIDFERFTVGNCAADCPRLLMKGSSGRSHARVAIGRTPRINDVTQSASRMARRNKENDDVRTQKLENRFRNPAPHHDDRRDPGPIGSAQRSAGELPPV